MITGLTGGRAQANCANQIMSAGTSEKAVFFKVSNCFTATSFTMSMLLNISLLLDKMIKTLRKRGIRPSHQGYEAQKHIPWH